MFFLDEEGSSKRVFYEDLFKVQETIAPRAKKLSSPFEFHAAPSFYDITRAAKGVSEFYKPPQPRPPTF